MHDSIKRIGFLLSLLFLSSCGEDSPENPLNNISDNCSLPNGHLKWTVEGNDYCANASLFADHALVMTMNGITLTGITITLELDSILPGTYPMKADINSILFTDQLGMAWQTTDDNPGTLQITSNNTSTNLLQASFSATLRNPLGLSKSLSQGTIKIHYTE